MSKSVRQSLYILRHAKAEPWMPGINDFKRSLSERGITDMRELAAWAGPHLPAPQRILCSPSTRTRETLLSLLGTWLPDNSAVEYRQEIYEATAGTLHALVQNAFESANTVMLVGHNPGLEYLVLASLRDQDAATVTKMPTGALAVIDFENGWLDDAGAGVLQHWICPKELRQS